jgi:hypothetical protein
MPATFGRGDINTLYRNFRRSLARDRAEVRQRILSGHAPEQKTEAPTSVVIVTFPVGWNADRVPVLFEAETVADIFGERVNVRAKTEQGLVREMHFAIATRLMRNKVEQGEARRIARSIPVFVADRLPARPSRGQILNINGEVAHDTEG